jgi:squalene/oxidosqualene cyclase-like protein
MQDVGIRPPSDETPDLAETIERGLDVLEETQAEHGAWEGDYGGPLFLLPLYVATIYIVDEAEFDDETREGIARYLEHHQNDDGGWGLHVESHSYVYTSVLNYVALRLLGRPDDDPNLQRAREWFLERGGAPRVPQWGQFVLAMLGLMPWEGVSPVPPELWLLPRSAPIHPGRFWCHARMVYLPMSYLYGRRATIEPDARLESIRNEIVPASPEEIDWAEHATDVAETDQNVPLSPLYQVAHQLLTTYEQRPMEGLRERALDFVLDQIHREDQNTEYICIGPINKLLNTLCWHFADERGGEAVDAHLEQLPNYLWEADDGIKMQGYNSSQLWDTTFAVQAICATGRQDTYGEMLESAHGYIESNQVLEEVPDREFAFRERSTGGWPFSNRDHGWPISDCTAEGLKSSLLLAPWVDEPLNRERLEAAVEQILSMQNPDGGWPTYETKRGPDWLEMLNPTQIFEDIMVDYSCIECTSACMQALDAFETHVPDAIERRIPGAIHDGRRFLLDQQRENGSWYGSWGICFTYGTWFGTWGLRAAGLPAGHDAIQRACDFLVEHQLEDGGWGELSESCRQREYVSTEEGQAVMTSWALMSLHAGDRDETTSFRRGVEFLKQRQRSDGRWPDEHIAGVFNRTCAIQYDNYLKIFPVWALALAES